jgi:hypothetical protein
VYRGWWGNVREEDHLGVPGVDGRIILRWIFKEWDGWAWIGLSGSGYGQAAGTCERGNEPSSFIKRGEFLD